MSVKRIIIDTDIGDDIDDALAIAFALKSPEIEPVGITTVFKNTELRSKIAVKLLELAGKSNIPVYTGCKQPIINRVNTEEIPCQFSDDMYDIIINKDMDAVDFIIQKVSTDNNIILVPIGPLTNIATAIIKKPQIKNRIKEIVLMGGAFYTHRVEWNIKCDPEAARIVFESGIPIKAIGLDVTLKCQLKEKDMMRISQKKTKLSKFLSDLISRWYEVSKHYPILHDPLAVCAVFNTEILKFQKEKIAVELKGEYTRGMTFNYTVYNKKTEKPNIYTACEVDSSKFIDIFMERTF